ncbi:MAG: undecaprenyl-diphosphate phosphatase [Acutalibacteraceae bacterium]|nr:undecaprenyl-diphosphate phosphatase [Acutalibacteraceae bacterium]
MDLATIIEFLKAALFGVVEGITEWLPISSTGHMILLNEIMPLNVSEEFWNMFEVVIQLGAILAVVVIFWSQIWPFKMKNKTSNESGIKSYVKMDIMSLWGKILVACIPAAVIGLLLDEILEKYLYNYVVVAVALIVFGVAFIVVENWNKNRTAKVEGLNDLTYKLVIVIGMFQLLAAIFPGVSRSGATIIGALLIGVSRTVAAEFTFFLAIPVMAGASLLKLLKFGFNFTANELIILIIGFVVAFLVSIVVIKFLLKYIKKHDFKVFGWYRIVLGALVLGYFALKTSSVI